MKGTTVTTEDPRAAAQEAAALRDFLLARYADDEAELATSSGLRHPGPWTVRRNPSQFAADLEAKRRIVGYRGPIGLPTDGTVPPGEGMTYLNGGHAAVAAERDRILRLLALPYAAHPDYRPEWKP